MASKGAINLQLNIDTQFKNVNTAVADFQKALSNIKIDNNFLDTKNIANTFQSQIAEIQKSLSEAANFKLSDSSLGDYQALLKSIQNQYSSLKSSVTDYQVALDNSKDAVQAQITQEIQAANIAKNKATSLRTQISEISTLKAAQEEIAKTGRKASEEEKALAKKYENTNTNLRSLRASLGHANKDYKDHNAKLQELVSTQKNYESISEQIIDITKRTGDEIKTANNARKEEVETAKAAKKAAEEKAKADAEAAKAQAKRNQETLARNKALAEATHQAALERQQWLVISSTFVSDFERAASGSDKLTSALEMQIAKWTSLGFIVHTATNAIRDIVQTYQELDDNLSAISAVSGISTNQLWGNMPQMIDNANELALSIDDLTNGMLLFYQQGLSTEETEIRLNAAGKMAAISQQDLATAVDQLTSTMNAFGMNGEDATNVVDVFAKMASKTATDVEELATAMARTASIAKNAGMTFEQTTAFIATMEETTRLSAEVIGNSLKSIIARFQKLKTDPGTLLEDGVNANDVEKALKKADVALRDTEGNFRNIGDVIMELSGKWDTLDTNTQKYIATMAAGVQQSSNFIALVSNNQSNVDNLAYALDAAGAAEEQFGAISNNISSALTRLDNNWTKLKTSFSEGRNILVDIVNVFSNFVGFLANIGSGAITAGAGIALLTAKIILGTVATQKRYAIEKLLNVVATSSLSNNKKKLALDALLEAQQKKLNKAQAENLLLAQGIPPADAATIAGSYGVATANGVQTFSWEALKLQIYKVIEALWLFTANHPVIAAITAITAALGAAIGAWSLYKNSLKESAKETQEEIDSLKESAKAHKETAKNYSDESKQLEDYITRLKEAKDNGENLTEIKKEIADSFDEEKLGIDATKASYDDLTTAIEENIKKREELIKQETYAKLKDEAKRKEEEAKQLKDNEKNKKVIGAKITDSSGKEISQEDFDKKYTEGAKKIQASSYAANSGGGFAETKEQFAKRIGFTYEIKYEIEDAEGNSLFSGTEEELKKKLAEIGKTFYTSSDMALAMEQSGLDTSDSGLNQEEYSRTLSLISKYSNENVITSDGNIADKAQQEVTDLKKYYDSIIATTGASFQEFIDFLNGKTDGMTNEVYNSMVQATSVWANAVSSNPAYQAIADQATKVQDSFDSALLELVDHEIINKEEAKKIGLKNLQIIEKALEAGGKESAKAVLAALNGEFSDALGKVEINDSAKENIKEKLQLAIGDAAQDFDFENIDTSIQNLFDQFSNGELDATQLTMALQAIASGSDALKTSLDPTIEAIQKLNAVNAASFTSISDVSTSWSDFNTNLGYLQAAADGTGISLENLTSLATAMGTTVDQLIASGGWTQIGDSFHASSEAADEAANSLTGLSDAELAHAQAEQEAVAVSAEATAQKLEAAAQDVRAKAATVSASKGLVLADNKVIAAAIKLAKARKQVNEQFGVATPAIDAVSEAETIEAKDYEELASELEAVASEQRTVAAGAKEKITYIQNLRTQLASASKDWRNYAKAAGGGGGASKGATKATNELTATLEAQKKALENQKQALQNQKSALEEQKKALDELNNSLKENFKLYLDLIKTRLNKEIDKQTETIKAFYDAIKDSIQSEIDTFEDQLNALNKKADEIQKAADNQKDSLSKLYDAAKAYYDAASDGIDNEIAGIDRVIERNNEKVEVLKEQQDAIQAQIDALDDAADSESKLLALEKARDALATARQQKTRLVLTNGGGWRFKTDKSAVQEAQSNLASAQRDYQKEVLERQAKKLDNQIDGIDKVNDNLDDVKDRLEGQKEILSDISDQWDTINDSLGKTANEIQEQTELIKKFQYGSNDSRYNELTNFAGGVTNNQQQQQEASDASNKYEEQSNADKKGTLAEAIEKLKEQQNQADQALEEYFTNQLSNNAESQKIQQEMKALIDSIVGTSIGSLESFNQYQEGINSAFDRANESASLNAQYINDINAAISRYEEWSNRLGMTTDEINARQAIENEINNATLGSLIEGGVTFNKLNDQYKEAIKNNDTSADIDRQVKVVENQISDVEKQISDVSNRISEAKEAANKDASGTNKTINSAANRIASAIANQPPAQITIRSPHTGNSGSTKVANKQISAVMNIGGMLGFSRGGVDDVTRTVAVHGTKNRPELILNNSQSAALFKYIDSMTRIPTLSSAGSARNALNSFGTTNNTTNSGINFTNCKFDIESNADNLDSLVQDLKQSASIRR